MPQQPTVIRHDTQSPSGLSLISMDTVALDADRLAHIIHLARCVEFCDNITDFVLNTSDLLFALGESLDCDPDAVDERVLNDAIERHATKYTFVESYPHQDNYGADHMTQEQCDNLILPDVFTVTDPKLAAYLLGVGPIPQLPWPRRIKRNIKRLGMWCMGYRWKTL